MKITCDCGWTGIVRDYYPDCPRCGKLYPVVKSAKKVIKIFTGEVPSNPCEKCRAKIINGKSVYCGNSGCADYSRYCELIISILNLCKEVDLNKLPRYLLVHGGFAIHTCNEIFDLVSQFIQEQ